MNEKINLFNLTDNISSNTHQNPELVKVFITQLFKEIEKGLTVTSFVNIEGLGIFRIIQSTPSDRILFLGGFDNDKKTHQPETENKEHDTLIINQQAGNNNHIDTPTEDVSAGPDEKEYLSSNGNNTGYHGVEPDNANDEGFRQGIKETENGTGDNSIDFLAEYEIHNEEEKKRKKKSNLRIIALLIITIIGTILLLVFLYPKPEKDNLSAPGITAPNIPDYTLLENNDSINYICRILVESELDFVSLAQDFYGYDIFWPYIYKANEKEVPNPLEIIKTGTVIMIPRLASELTDKNNQYSIEKAKIMANEIFSKFRGNTAVK